MIWRGSSLTAKREGEREGRGRQRQTETETETEKTEREGGEERESERARERVRAIIRKQYLKRGFLGAETDVALQNTSKNHKCTCDGPARTGATLPCYATMYKERDRERAGVY